MPTQEKMRRTMESYKFYAERSSPTLRKFKYRLPQDLSLFYDRRWSCGLGDILGNVCRKFVPALEIVPAHGQHLDSHADAITKRADLGAMIVRPLDRNLNRAQLEFVGEEEQFRIETPALNVLPGKNRLRGAAGERLEAALRVAIFQAQHNAESQVKQASVQLSVPWLTFGL